MLSADARELLGLRLRQARMRLDVVRFYARIPLRALWEMRRECAVAFAGLGGWALVTESIARIGGARIVWPLSAGLMLLSLCGWGWLRTLVTQGLYALTAPGDERG